MSGASLDEPIVNKGALRNGREQRERRDQPYLQVAVAAAKEAGRIQKEHVGRIARVEYSRGDRVPVTRSGAGFCEKAVVGSGSVMRLPGPRRVDGGESVREETGLHGNGCVDPLDGTTNYLHGLPCFSFRLRWR